MAAGSRPVRTSIRPNTLSTVLFINAIGLIQTVIGTTFTDTIADNQRQVQREFSYKRVSAPSQTGRPSPPQCRFYHAKKQDSSRIDGMSARRRAVAASRCRKPTACSRYPAIRGCSTRLTPSCRFRRTLSRAVRLGPSSSSRAGCGILNYLTRTCNSKLFLALR